MVKTSLILTCFQTKTKTWSLNTSTQKNLSQNLTSKKRPWIFNNSRSIVCLTLPDCRNYRVIAETRSSKWNKSWYRWSLKGQTLQMELTLLSILSTKTIRHFPSSQGRDKFTSSQKGVNYKGNRFLTFCFQMWAMQYSKKLLRCSPSIYKVIDAKTSYPFFRIPNRKSSWLILCYWSLEIPSTLPSFQLISWIGQRWWRK